MSKVLSRRRETGETAARAQCCHLTPKLAQQEAAIQAEVEARADATIAELRRWLLLTHQVSASDGLMHKTLAKLDLTFKKSPCMPPSSNAPTLPRRVRRGERNSLS